jgi:hypothetical protein
MKPSERLSPIPYLQPAGGGQARAGGSSNPLPEEHVA